MTDAVSVDYNGAAVVLLVVGLLALLGAVLAYLWIDDRHGESLARDLRTALRGRPAPPSGETLGGYLIAFEEEGRRQVLPGRAARQLPHRPRSRRRPHLRAGVHAARPHVAHDPARPGPGSPERPGEACCTADRADRMHNVVGRRCNEGRSWSPTATALLRGLQGAAGPTRAGHLPTCRIRRRTPWCPTSPPLLDVPPEIGLARRGSELDRLESGRRSSMTGYAPGPRARRAPPGAVRRHRRLVAVRGSRLADPAGPAASGAAFATGAPRIRGAAAQKDEERQQSEPGGASSSRARGRAAPDRGRGGPSARG